MDRDSRVVLLSVAALLMTGIVMTYSSSAVYAFGKYGDSAFFLKRHLAYMSIGLMVAVVCMSVKVRRIQNSARPFMLLCLFLLGLVLVPGIGDEAGGARRWIRLAGAGFQPSELAKFGIILYLADFTSRKRYVMKDIRIGFLPPLIVILLTAGLILLEPDMGTSVSVLFIGMIMLFMSGVRIKHVAGVTLAGIPLLAAAVLAEPYRIKRILTVFDPMSDARGAGYQLVQSFIALGSGGMFGIGLGSSRQKLFYLPESHTDFVFSIIGEETGFLGAASVLILFGVLVWFGMRCSLRSEDPFSSRAIAGITAMIAFEVIVNVGVTAGVLPTKGLPLPLISYGGSSLVCHLGAIGALLNMARGDGAA